MTIPDDPIIPMEKLTRHLLVPRGHDDKSNFLSQAGFGPNNPDALMDALRRLAIGADAQENGDYEYGTFYIVRGPLAGPNGHSLAVVLVWLRWHSDGSFRFVTLKPDRRSQP